jgi:hypothetical protein
VLIRVDELEPHGDSDAVVRAVGAHLSLLGIELDCPGAEAFLGG